jgi:hypothetical protein
MRGLRSDKFEMRDRLLAACVALVLGLAGACSTTNGASDGGVVDGGAGDAAPAACASPGAPTPGIADTHCTGSDGGASLVQPTNAASCHPNVAADGGGGNACPYGDTMYGAASDDDDCKYHVTWTSSPICEGAEGVTFTAVVTKKSDGSPLVGGNTTAEVFTSSPADAGCDNQSTHPGPNGGGPMTEGPPGTYTGNIQFDRPGLWTLRFHFHQECDDLLPDSPHGHAAYSITVQ